MLSSRLTRVVWVYGKAGLSQRLADPAIYQRDPQAAQKAAERLAAIDDELTALLERWEILEARAGNTA